MAKHAGEGKKWMMRGDERGGENRQVNNGVCLRFSSVSRLWVAQRFATASANLVSVQSQGPVTVRPHTHKYTHAMRELLPWEPTPLWLFPSQENNRHQSFSTSLSLSLTVSLSSLFLVATSSHPSSSLGPAPSGIPFSSSFLSSMCRSRHLCPPVPLLFSLHVFDSHEFDLLCIISPRWDLYSSHTWKAKHYLNRTGTNTTLVVFQAAAKETWWKKDCLSFQESRRGEHLGKTRKFFGCPLFIHFSLKHGGVRRDFPWVTHWFLWTCSRQVIFY